MTGAAADRAAESEPNDASGDANPVTASRMAGTLDPMDADVYALSAANAGDGITAIADADPDGDGLLAGVALELLGPDAATVLATSEPGVRRAVAVGRLAAPAPGTYFVWLRVEDKDGRVATSDRIVVTVTP